MLYKRCRYNLEFLEVTLLNKFNLTCFKEFSINITSTAKLNSIECNALGALRLLRYNGVRPEVVHLIIYNAVGVVSCRVVQVMQDSQGQRHAHRQTGSLGGAHRKQCTQRRIGE